MTSLRSNFPAVSAVAGLTLSMLSLSLASPARADEPVGKAQEREETFNDRIDRSQWSSGKTVAVYSVFGASLVSLGVGIFSFAKSQSATNDLGKGDFRYGDCKTQADCARLADLTHDDKVWSTEALR